MTYVVLERRFVPFDERENAEETAIDSLRYQIFGHSLEWSDVLKNRFVVILGEAGTGKTTELQEQARRLEDAGCVPRAFFIPLEDLADDQISIDIEQSLNEWKETQDEGVFFLDAVDEARLGHPSALRRALDAFRRLLRPMEGRARLVVSCRFSDWQYRTDAKTLTGALRFFQPHSPPSADQVAPSVADSGTRPDAQSAAPTFTATEDWKPEIELYRLDPLDNGHIARLAEAWGVTDVDRFMQALTDADLQAFAGRPRDLEWLVRYWLEHGAFGSLSETIDENVRHKLEEHNPAYERQSTDFSPERCRKGIEALAAASVLCERPLIAIPDPEIAREPPARSFDPAEVLSGWGANEIRTLLTRAIFDPATFGRARFHDPTVRDYLAAHWMANRPTEGQRLSRIRRLVLGDAFGEIRPVPSKRSVLGWLLLFSPDIRSDAIQAAPDVVLYCGDASQIPVEELEQALRNLATLLRKTSRTDWAVFDSDVRRIADPRLESTVRDLLVSHSDIPELVRLLLRMVRLAPMPGCADLAFDISLDSTRDDGLRILAAYAVISAGTNEQKTALLENALTADGLSNRILGGLCAALFPGVADIDTCLTLARRGSPEKPNDTGGIGQSFEHHIAKECPRQQLQDLLAGLLDLARTPPQIEYDESQVISEKYAWTLEAIFEVLKRLLKEEEDEQLNADLIADAYLLVSNCQYCPSFLFSVRDDFRKLLMNKTKLHQAIYWHVVRQRQLRRPGEAWWAWRVLDEPLVLTRDDLDWLLNDIRILIDENEIESACDTALAVWGLAGRPEELKPPIIEAIEQSPIAGEALKQRARNTLTPPPREEMDGERQFREQQEARKAAEDRALAEIRAQLADRVDVIRIGDDFPGLLQCYRSMQRGIGNSSSSWTQSNWNAVVADFGEEIAAAAQQGFKISWKKWSPPLPREREETAGVENGILTGLTGLELLAQDGQDFSQLTTEEAEIATRYAIRELNGFPDWLVDIVAGKPDVVREVLSRQLEANFLAPVGETVHPDTLSKLRYGPGAIRVLCTDAILENLARTVSCNANVLFYALETLFLENSATHARLASLAAQRVRDLVATGTEDQALVWLEAWLLTDAASAIDFLEVFLTERGRLPDPFVQRLCASFGERSWGGRESGDGDLFQPKNLERFIPHVFSHVRFEDDPEHTGVYTVGEREHAQTFRNSLPHRLANQKGAEAQRVLNSLASRYEDFEIKAWFIRLAKDQAAMALEYLPRSPSDIAEFATGREMEPRTGDELFEIALERLSDVKYDLETGRFSDRQLFQPGMPERDIQIWLAGRLDRKKNGRYSVVREEEDADSQENDIRLHHPAAGYVTIELKPVDSKGSRYSFNELVVALRDQLIGQYMRAVDSRHGVLVVAMLEQRQWNSPEGKNRFGFSELIDRLNAVANELTQNDSMVDQLCVIGIDFCGP